MCIMNINSRVLVVITKFFVQITKIPGDANKSDKPTHGDS